MKQEITICDARLQDAESIAGVIRRSFRDVTARFSLTRDNCPNELRIDGTAGKSLEATPQKAMYQGQCFAVIALENL